MKRVYLDHNATTDLRPQARELLLAILDEGPANPSSVHASGRRARHHVDLAREQVAAALEVHEEEVIFTAGGSEANNLAVQGGLAARGAGRAFLVTAIEHSSVLAPGAAMQERGHPLLSLEVDAEGRPRQDALERALRAGPAGLVSIGAANNEVGTLADLEALRAAIDALPSAERPLLHTDAVQALGRVPLPLAHADLASFSAHKVGGPVGVGVLVRRRGVPLLPITYGGGQEAALRAGTEAVASLRAAALAIELACHERVELAGRTRRLARMLWEGARGSIPGVRLLGPSIDAHDRLPNTLALALPGLDGRVLVARLDLEGLEASAGSACASGSLEPSHVLLAMGLGEEAARAGLRLSLGRETTAENIHTAVDILRKTCGNARKSQSFDDLGQQPVKRT